MDESEVAEYGRHYMGDLSRSGKLCGHELCFVEGRYSMEYNHYQKTFVITDLFHTKTSQCRVVITSGTVDGFPLSLNDDLWMKSFFPLGLNLMLLIFETNKFHKWVLGLVKIDHERSLAIVDQAVVMPVVFEFDCAKWFSQSSLPSLYEGLILRTFRHDPFSPNYLRVKLNDNHQLEISQLDVTLKMNSFGCFDGLLYGLVVNRSNAGVNQPPSIDLVKYSLSTGEHVQQQTANYKILDETMVNYINRMSHLTCCIGKTLFFNDFRVGIQEIFSLNLDTLEWRSTNIRLRTIRPISTHEKGILLVAAYHSPSSMERIFRFVVNEPDKLSDLSWLQLKRIFDARPSAYEFILSQLPKNFKQKCPLPPQ